MNEDVGYLHKIEDCRFIDGVFSLVKKAKSSGYKIFIVTNQSGIGRGYFTEAQFHDLMEWIVHQFSENGGLIDGVFHCPDAPNQDHGRDTCRKPSPEMFNRAKIEFSICMLCSVAVGDRVHDVVAAAAAGVRRVYLFSPGATRDDSMVLGDLSKISF